MYKKTQRLVLVVALLLAITNPSLIITRRQHIRFEDMNDIDNLAKATTKIAEAISKVKPLEPEDLQYLSRINITTAHTIKMKKELPFDIATSAALYQTFSSYRQDDDISSALSGICFSLVIFAIPRVYDLACSYMATPNTTRENSSE